MNILRHSSAALLALFIGSAHLPAAHASGTSGAAASSTRIRVQLKSPFSRKTLPALSSGHLVNIAGNPLVSESEYKDLRNAIETLLTKYSPKNHYFIGTGRDPAPLIAALENLGGRELAMNFPASNVVGSTNITPALLAKYFKRLIPDEAQRKDILSGRRKLVLVDQSNSGKTPNSLEPYFQTYFDAIGSPAKMIKVAFSAQANTVLHGVVPIVTTEFPDVARYLYPPYEGVVSEFPRHVLGNDPMTALVQRKEYRDYKDAVMERMKRDKTLHTFLVKKLGVAHEDETPAERQARIAEEQAQEAKELAAAQKAEQAKIAKERSEQAAKLKAARGLPTALKTTIAKLVLELPLRQEGHDKGPYLSDSAKTMNDWLNQALVAQTEASALVPKLKSEGPNLVVSLFMDKVEEARKGRKIRNRDYRRLMGHALSAAVMDATMTKALIGRFEKSRHFRRELSEEQAYFMNSHSEKQRPETANMAQNFNLLAQHLKLPPAPAESAESEAN